MRQKLNPSRFDTYRVPDVESNTTVAAADAFIAAAPSLAVQVTRCFAQDPTGATAELEDMKKEGVSANAPYYIFVDIIQPGGAKTTEILGELLEVARRGVEKNTPPNPWDVGDRLMPGIGARDVLYNQLVANVAVLDHFRAVMVAVWQRIIAAEDTGI